MTNTQVAESSNQHPRGMVEVFKIWPTFQGEGPYQGYPAIFIRLAGCNLDCPGCDTDYTSERKLCNPGFVVLKCNEIAPSNSIGLVVITGGEPFRQNIGPLVKQLILSGYDVQIETNGTLFVPDIPYDRISIVCSPKTPKVNPQIESHIDYWKYVLDADHVDPVDGLPTSVLGMDLKPARRHPDSDTPIYVQPMDAQDEERTNKNIQAVIKSCFQFHYRICLQTQKLLGLE